jgi:ATP-dependent DNA helicase RecG
LYKIKETTDERLTFLVTIPVHEGCGESSETDLLGSETHNESSERKEISSETTSKSSERKRKSSERNVDTMKYVYNCIDTKNVAETLRYVFIYSKCQ